MNWYNESLWTDTMNQWTDTMNHFELIQWITLNWYNESRRTDTMNPVELIQWITLNWYNESMNWCNESLWTDKMNQWTDAMNQWTDKMNQWTDAMNQWTDTMNYFKGSKEGNVCLNNHLLLVLVYDDLHYFQVISRQRMQTFVTISSAPPYSSVSPAISLGFTILGEIFACVIIFLFNPTIAVVTFHLGGWCFYWQHSPV